MFEKLDLVELCSNPYEFDLVLSRQIHDAVDISLSYYKRIMETIHENELHVVRLENTRKSLRNRRDENREIITKYGCEWAILGHRKYVDSDECEIGYDYTFVKEMQFNSNPNAYEFTISFGPRYHVTELNSDEVLGGSRLVLEETNGCNNCICLFRSILWISKQ